MLRSVDRTARVEAFFSDPARYLRRNHRVALRAEVVKALLGPVVGTIVDLGCGNGAVSLALLGEGNSVVLIDKSPAMLAEAERAIPLRYAASVMMKCADALCYACEPADVVLATGLLAHVDSTDEVMAAIARNLKSGGRTVVQFSDAGQPLNKMASLLFRIRGRHYRKTPRSEVMAAARRHGLILVAEQSHLLVLPGMPRIVGRRLLAYDRAIRRHPLLARHGLETLALFEKC